MINVLIVDENSTYRQGMISFVKKIFSETFNKEIHVTSALTESNVSDAHIIFLSLCRGEHLSCIPELQKRKECIVIGILDGELPEVEILPHCFHNMVMITRKSTLPEVSEKILTAWRERTPFRCHSCSGCACKQMTQKQEYIMTRFRWGKTVSEIASELALSEKTVYTHKYIVMRKFGLRTDHELLIFLKKMYAHKYSLFSDIPVLRRLFRSAG